MDPCRTELAIELRRGHAVGSIVAVVFATLIGLLLRGYRLAISPVLGANCRFEPSCSRFAEEAIARHGVRQGTSLAAQRLLRCHPWGGPGGFDPVP